MLSCIHDEERISADHFAIKTAAYLSVYLRQYFQKLKSKRE